MNKKYVYLTISALLVYTFSFTQEYSYKHYDNDNGLAGNTVYSVTQDTKGYLWFATDNGLSRFDGEKFTNFTTKDGLPDNEVVLVFADSCGRVWIITFNKKICYFKDGKIKTKENDSLLKQINFKEIVTRIYESPNEQKKIYLTNADQIVEIFNNKPKIIFQNGIPINRIIKEGTKINARLPEVFLKFNDSFFIYRNDSWCFAAYKKNYRKELYFKQDSLDRSIFINPSKNFISLSASFTDFFINTHNGVQRYEYDENQFETFLPKERVCSTFRDKENNLWFCTLGHGVFKLKSKEIKLYSFDANSNNSEVFVVNYSDKKILAGVSFGKLHSIDIEKKTENKVSFGNKKDESLNAMTVNRLTSILPLNKDLLIYGFDSYLLKIEKNNQKFAFLKPIKSLSKINDKTILVGTSNYAVTMNVDDLKIIDTIYNQRCTAVEFFNKDFYIGTQNGLYVNKKRLDFLNERVTAITFSKDSIVWIATNSSGIFGLKNKKVLYHLTENNGLTSNNVKSLFADSTNIWVGTFSGLNKVNRKTFSITKYTMDDGLPSNIINSIYVDKNSIWLGTNLGLVNFDENKIDKTSFCNIDLVKIKNADTSLNTQKIELAYNQNNISFEHTGISFKSEKAVVFFYKMEGIDSSWIETSSRIVSYPSIPSGNYTFKIYAINKLGVKSPILSYPILVKKPFWEETYFKIVTSILFLILIAITVNYFLSRIKKRNAEKTRYLNELHFAKQMALQTQMNPHFIFNCLNNIQRFIFKNDIENTNKYLTEFATLIRTTLENADKLLINLSDEINYLKMYLEMENLRFDNKLHFECIVDENVDVQNIEIPTMLLQPFIENSIKHGILNLKDRAGLIKLEFFIENNFLNCKIIDNGIGRKESAILKLNEKLLFESKGIEITTRRIQMFNFNKKQEIKLEIKDLYDAYENAIGTEVHLQIPTDLNDND